MSHPLATGWLEALGPGMVGRRIDLGADPLRIGRGASASVPLNDPMVSREHAEIRRQGDAFVIADLGSTHGTWVDGERVQEAVLKAGSRIRLGETDFIFRLAQDAVPTAMLGVGALPVAAVPRAASSSGRTGVPSATSAVAPAPATMKAAGRRGWVFGCGIALFAGLCGCGLLAVLSVAGGLPFGLDAAVNQTIGGLAEAVSGDSTPYTPDDLALALALPTVEERDEILANFGPPDEFEISIVQVEGGQVRVEAWRYYGYGTRVDFVDGEIIWTIDLEPGPAQSIFPAWYDPLAFDSGMTLDEARDVLTSASPAGFVPEEIDLSEGGEELAGGVMLVGDQIMLVFERGALVYAETFGASLEEAAE